MNWNHTKEYGFYMTAVEGVVPEPEYQELLKRKWDGQTTPIDFHGYNHYPDYWPFWSSEPYTYVTNMLALAKFSNTYESADVTDNVNESDYKEVDKFGTPIVY